MKLLRKNNMNTEIVTEHILLDNLTITNDEIAVTISGDIDTECATKVCEQLYSLDRKNMPFIPVLIHSGGGNVDDLLTIMNCIDALSTPIMTICQSCACSAAAVIFALGSTNMRIMAPNSYLMFHESSMGAEGKQLDIAASNNHFLRIDKLINKKIEKHVELEPNFFENHHNDLYLNSKDALKLGIASHVGFPVIKLRAHLDMCFDIKCNKRHEIEDHTKRAKFLKVTSGASQDKLGDSLKHL